MTVGTGRGPRKQVISCGLGAGWQWLPRWWVEHRQPLAERRHSIMKTIPGSGWEGVSVEENTLVGTMYQSDELHGGNSRHKEDMGSTGCP